MNNQCCHTRAFSGLDQAYCPDCKKSFKPKSEEYKQILTKPCLSALTSFQELGDLLEPEKVLEELLRLNSSKGMLTQQESLEATGETSPSTPISEIITQGVETLTLLQSDSPAQILPAPGTEPESMANLALSGLKHSESSLNADPNLLLSRIQKVCLSEELESVLPLSEWQDIVSTTRNSYRQRNLEQRIIGQDSLSCPTLTSGSKTPNSRAAGTTKCERWFKEQGLIPDGYQLSAPAMAKLMGYPEDWFKALCPYPQELPAELEPDILPEEPSPQIKQEGCVAKNGKVNNSTRENNSACH